MKRKNWPVEGHGIRPAGSPNHCFYCHIEKGEEHKEDCVIRSKTIVIEATIEMVIDVPEFWSKEDLEFHRNEGSWCSSNLLGELQALDERKGCVCDNIEIKYLRDATEDDEIQDHWCVVNLPT